MNSIPPKPTEIARDVAAEVAFELGRPWRVEDLRTEALQACRTAMQRAARSGLTNEQVCKRMRPRIKEQVLKAGKGMDALPPGKKKPTPEQVETSLRAFSIEQWITLIDDLDRVGV